MSCGACASTHPGGQRPQRHALNFQNRSEPPRPGGGAREDEFAFERALLEDALNGRGDKSGLLLGGGAQARGTGGVGVSTRLPSEASSSGTSSDVLTSMTKRLSRLETAHRRLKDEVRGWRERGGRKTGLPFRPRGTQSFVQPTHACTGARPGRRWWRRIERCWLSSRRTTR